MKHTYGSCIQASKILYGKLKKQGKQPSLVNGHVILKDGKKSCHTWVKVGNKIYDPTKDQFDNHGGVRKYLKKNEFRKKRE